MTRDKHGPGERENETSSRLNRRDVLKAGAAAGLASTVPWSIGSVAALTSNISPTKYETTLPNLLDDQFIAQPQGTLQGADHYEMELVEGTHNFHPSVENVTVWGYRDDPDKPAGYLGPTFETQTNQPIKVTWKNQLTEGHLLDDSVVTDFHGACELDEDEPRTVTHLHGGNVPAPGDGFPELTFRPGDDSGVYDYPNRRQAATLWYHDHALGITRLNVYAGLAGFYIVRDAAERRLNLPTGDYEIPIVLQDKAFDGNGSNIQLAYPPADDPKPEFAGDIAVLNSKIWPKKSVDRRKYRLRFLNGSNSRFYNLKLVKYDENEGVQPDTRGPNFYQIGTDGGLLESPVEITAGKWGRRELLLAPGERADVVVDFSDVEANTQWVLFNDAATPFSPLGGGGFLEYDDAGEPPDFPSLFELMRFDVEETVDDPSELPSRLNTVPSRPESAATNQRDFVLVEDEDDQGRLKLLLGTREDYLDTDTGQEWADTPHDVVQRNTTEIWSIDNLTVDTHPIHLHLVQFQVLDRQPLKQTRPGEDKWQPEVAQGSSPTPPDENEQGLKDTVRMNPGERTRILVHFGDFPGWYVWHCHILEHEDHEMMRPFYVAQGKDDAQANLDGPLPRSDAQQDCFDQSQE